MKKDFYDKCVDFVLEIDDLIQTLIVDIKTSFSDKDIDENRYKIVYDKI